MDEKDFVHKPKPTTVEEAFYEAEPEPLQSIREKDWYMFAVSYFKLAETGCNQFLQGESLASENKYIVIAIIFNLKHGIEVILKTLIKVSRIDLKKHMIYRNYQTPYLEI